MAALLKKPVDAVKYKSNAAKIKAGINKYLWLADKGYFGQYFYGRNFKMLSPRSEALGEALCVYFNIADPAKQKSLIEKVPVTDYGISCIYPQIPGIPPYHNNGIWPFVQSFWNLAAAKAGNGPATNVAAPTTKPATAAVAADELLASPTSTSPVSRVSPVTRAKFSSPPNTETPC